MRVLWLDYFLKRFSSQLLYNNKNKLQKVLTCEFINVILIL